jgi:ketosteroid isomerase-like protein
MSNIIRKGEELFAALRSDDVDALQRLLSPDFRGELTAGLPHGLGRVYEGLESMMNEGWGALGDYFEMVPEVDKLYDGGDVLIARGNYVGKVKATGKPIRAAFAHFWSFDGERFTGVWQVTDSATWEHSLT